MLLLSPFKFGVFFKKYLTKSAQPLVPTRAVLPSPSPHASPLIRRHWDEAPVSPSHLGFLPSTRLWNRGGPWTKTLREWDDPVHFLSWLIGKMDARVWCIYSLYSQHLWGVKGPKICFFGPKTNTKSHPTSTQIRVEYISDSPLHKIIMCIDLII